jgi:RND family efflux transporter MFP subunit
MLLLAAGAMAWLAGGAGARLGLPGFTQEPQAVAGPGSPAQPATPVLEFTAHEVVAPQAQRWSAWLEFSGPLVAPQTATLRSRAAGTLLALSVTEGQRVQTGQLLARLELPELGSRLAERQAQLEAVRATLAQAQRQHANNESLAQQQFISPSALDHSRLALQGAQAQVAAAAAALDTTRSGLRDTSLVAPIAGIVAKRHALPGEQVAAEQPLLTLVDLRTLELWAHVGTHEVARLAPGQPVQVRVEGLDGPVAGRIERIAPAAEPGTRAIAVVVALANPGERLRAGQYATARVELVPTAGSPDHLTVPEAAVLQASGQDQVWVIDQGHLARRAVQLGRRDATSGRVEVLQGLQADSQVLAARFDNLREGAPAKVMAATATAQAPDTARSGGPATAGAASLPN